VTAGVRGPTVILPASLLGPNEREDLAAALAHEMAHVCRRDYLWNLIYELLFLPVAFHPLALLIIRRLGDTRELACDELAAKVLGTSIYAKSLVRLAHDMSRRVGAALAANYTLGVFDANILEERVMKLLNPRAGGHLAKLSLFLAAFLISSLSFAAVHFSFGIAQDAAPSPTGATSGGVSGGIGYAVGYGVSGTISGGVSGGVTGGVKAGVSGAAPGPPATAKTASPSQSENKTGSLAGIVVDSSGARIPKAEVRLVSRNNAFQKSVESDETGNFSFDDVPAGRYTLEVSSTGMGGVFRSFEFKAEGEPPFFPFVLHPGSVSETVSVTAKSPHSLGDKAAKAGPNRIRVGGAVQAAKLIEGAQPSYPAAAKSRGVQGAVVLEATISAEGGVADLKVISSPDDDLAKASLDAVREWRYQPTLLNGDPVQVVTTVSVNFTLQD
jgi:TonB family protein